MTCTLIMQVTGATDPTVGEIPVTACEACCQDFLPSQGRLNRYFAGTVLVAAHKIVDLGGVPGCDTAFAKKVVKFAQRHLPIVFTEADRLAVSVPKYSRPCFYLGPAIADSAGRTPQEDTCGKGDQFECRHEAFERTTDEHCRRCRYYDPHLRVGGAVSTWAVGVLTSPRKTPTIERTVRSLAVAGWPEVQIFAEPGATLPPGQPADSVTQRQTKVLAWPNFLLALWELMLRHPEADAYLMCEDDVVFCRGLRTYLEQTLWPATRLGVVSLFASAAQEQISHRGFYPVNFGSVTWGAQALVFPNPSARAFVRHPDVVNHRARGPLKGEDLTDALVGYWCNRTGLDYYLHTPSLAQHIGDTSTLWENTDLAGRRVAATFPGEHVDIRECMANPPNSAAKLPPP